MSDSLQPHGLQPARLLCPWHSPDKNTGVGCHAVLQGVFPTQESHLHLLWLLHYRQILYRQATAKAPYSIYRYLVSFIVSYGFQLGLPRWC